MLSVGECGNGSLFDICFAAAAGPGKPNITYVNGIDISKQPTDVTVKIDNKKDFRVPEMGPIVSIELCPEAYENRHGTFIIS